MTPWHAVISTAMMLALLPAGALAQEDPEAIYAKLHSATLAGNSDEVLSYATARQKADLASKSKAEKDAVIQVLAKLMPRTYSITGKTIAPDGNSAVLRGSGVGELMGRTQMYLTANFLKEAGAWKVDQWQWTNDKPTAAMNRPAPTPRPAAPAPQPKPVASVPAAKPTPAKTAPAATAPATPAPAPDSAAPACVFKPVMTSEDMKACGIGAP